MTEWHINADEPVALDYNVNFKSEAQVASFYTPDPFRSSDHDPVLVGLCPSGTPPQLSDSVTPNVLWPPNHKYVTVNATVGTSDPEAAISLVSATSSEPDNGSGDGNTTNDIVQLSPTSFSLRAERSGGGLGRIYTITYEAVDARGDRTEVNATVTVPANKGRSGDDEVGAENATLEEDAQDNYLFLPSVQR